MLKHKASKVTKRRKCKMHATYRKMHALPYLLPNLTQNNVFVPETCIPYLSHSCRFINCSVSLSYLSMLICLTNVQVCLLHKSSARWRSCQSTCQNMEMGVGPLPTSPILRKMALMLAKPMYRYWVPRYR